MVTFRETAKNIKLVNEREWKVLETIEKYIGKYERVPIEKIIKATNYSREFIEESIDKFREFGWLEKFQQPYDSVRLLTSGVDALALHILANRDIVVGIGRQIGVGKESDVYEGITSTGEKISLKVFRLGRISFKDVTRKREYYDTSRYKPNWIIRNYLAAKREYQILKFLYDKGVSVPRPLARVKHIIVMEELKGDLLVNYKDLPNPDEMLNNILREVKRAFDIGIVNGDLSAFNIFISENYKPILIDWPQASVQRNERSKELIIRDVKYIVAYFNKKFNMNIDPHKILSEHFNISI